MSTQQVDDASVNSRASSAARERPSRSESLSRGAAMRRESPARSNQHAKSRYSIESAQMQASSSGAISHLKLPPRLPPHQHKLEAKQKPLGLKRTSSGGLNYNPQASSCCSGGESDRERELPPCIPTQLEFIQMVHSQDRRAKRESMQTGSDSELVAGEGRQGRTSRRRESDSTRGARPQPSRDLASLQPPARTGIKKPAVALTTWVRVWPSGESGLLQTEKSLLIQNLGIQVTFSTFPLLILLFLIRMVYILTDRLETLGF